MTPGGQPPRNPLIRFLRGALGMPIGWQVWLVGLVAANLVVPLAFWSTLEARVVVAVFSVGAMAMMALTARFGYTRILGAAHVLWLGLVPWLVTRTPLASDAEAGFAAWLYVVIAVNGVSVVIDVVDVVRWIRGDRAEPACVLG